MQPYLPTFTLSSALSLLFFASVSAFASHNGLTKRYPTKGGGYRCGNIIFSQDLIDEAAQQAAFWPYRDFTQDSSGEKSIHPVKYEGNLKFITDLELWLWPLSPMGHESLNVDLYFLVLEFGLSNIVGVIWQHGNNLHGKCIKEPDLFDLSGHNFALGYRCPHTIYPFGIITRALLNSKGANPARFVDENIFEEYMTFFRWPISPDGNFDASASDSIIMDNDLNLIGMVYKRRNGYFRCRLTIKDNITPEFVGRALEQKPTILEPHSLDVFHCREYFIRSDQILAGVADAHETIKEKRKIHDYRGFPALYKSTVDSGSTVFYLWPIRITGSRLLYKAKFSSVEIMFAVIDDFSNVHNIIMRVGGNELADCERKTVDRTLYKSRLSYYSRKLTEYRTLISVAPTPQTDLDRALAAGEIGVKGSTRP